MCPRSGVQKFVNDRGAQLRKIRLHKLRVQATEKLRKNPAAAFECMRPEMGPHLSLAAIKRNDGTLTLSSETSGARFSASTRTDPPPPDIDPFMDKYSKFIINPTVNVGNVKDIRTRLEKCKDTGATGLDVWSLKDFKRLPDEIFELLCCFYELVESVGVWPIGLTHAAVTLIPKNEGYDPMNMRPISVLPTAYRLWAAVRCKQCTEWQESWITHGQHGCRRGHGTSDALLRLADDLECAFLEGVPMYGVALDFAKAFDHVLANIT